LVGFYIGENGMEEVGRGAFVVEVVVYPTIFVEVCIYDNCCYKSIILAFKDEFYSSNI
jgi:hypothetical protein